MLTRSERGRPSGGAVIPPAHAGNTLDAIDAGDYNAAARELGASRWYGQVGRRGPANVRKMRAG